MLATEREIGQWPASKRAGLRLATIFVLVIELILNAIDGIVISYHESIPILKRVPSTAFIILTTYSLPRTPQKCRDSQRLSPPSQAAPNVREVLMVCHRGVKDTHVAHLDTAKNSVGCHALGAVLTDDSDGSVQSVCRI